MSEKPITGASGGSTNLTSQILDNKTVARLKICITETILKHFCQSVSLCCRLNNINIVQYEYCYYLCKKSTMTFDKILEDKRLWEKYDNEQGN